MTFGTGNAAELLWPGILEIWGNNYDRYEPLYSKVFRTLKATKRFEKFQGMTGLGLPSIKSEGSDYATADPMQGFQKEMTPVVYALMTSVTREMIDYEQYAYIRELPAMLAESMRQAEETTAWNVINRATNAAYTGADGIVLASASHITPTGFTYSNLLTAAADLTQTSIETMFQQIMAATDDQNLPIKLVPEVLVIAEDNNFRARKILESAYVTGSADNDVNGIPGILKNLVVTPYITDKDSWGVTTSARNGLTFLRRDSAEIKRDNEFDTENMKIAIRARWDVSWINPRHFYYTPGA